MRFLIDGYNLLHATDLFGAGELAGTLRGSREALLDFLASRLTEKERQATLIVFDSKDAPPGLPDQYDLEGITVQFSRGYPDADTLIEEIIETAKGTRYLTVVSGDRRVQRAARSRGAKPMNSDAWFAEIARRQPQGDLPMAKPMGPIGDNDHWVQEFQAGETLAEIEREAANAPPPKRLPPHRKSTADEKQHTSAKNKKRHPNKPSKPDQPQQNFGEGILDPFPPGYADDLLDE